MNTTAANRIPRHVAIIMDGNGRWARQRGWPRLRGHREGAESISAVLRVCKEVGIEILTLYAFSVENWVRPREEVHGLMRLLRRFLREREHELHEHRTRLRAIGRLQDLPPAVRAELERVIAATAHYRDRQLVLALSYGGRAEIADAARRIAQAVRDGQLDPQSVNEEVVARHLYAPDLPDPDLVIRTSGELRLSNFLLWQISYAELYFTPVLWPDFREEEFRAALASYRGRRRRFGDIQ
ncbi:MAG: isoprenyl transferase [Kiritimatiellae bacterium]|nr:isoprenyl transferase [Kiritimatiellia bacterium]